MLQQAIIAFLWVGLPLALVVWTMTRPVERYRADDMEQEGAQPVPAAQSQMLERPALVPMPPNNPFPARR